MLTQFPDAEAIALELFAPFAPVYTVLPATISQAVIHVTRVGGDSDRFSDYPRIEVSVYSPTRAESWQVMEQCRTAVWNSARTLVAGTLIDTARDETPPQQIPDPSELRRVTATFRFSWRRPTS